MSFPRYPAYKPSGVEWLGEVPEHWEVLPLKREFVVVGGSTPKSDIQDYWDGGIQWITPADLSRLQSFEITESNWTITTEGLNSWGTTKVPSGSVVISTRAPIGSLGIAGIDLCTNQGCKALVPINQISPRFTAYFLSTATEALNIQGRGATFLEISGDDLGAFKASIPPCQEQLKIATFLDRETAKIDALIAEQQRLIELLQEKRQAVISHAVTKGLNPDAPMKDSGMDWVGEVPEHWSVMGLTKTIGPIVDYRGRTPSKCDSGTLLVTARNIRSGKIDYSLSEEYVDPLEAEELLQRGRPVVGDVLFTMKAPLGQVALVDREDIALAQRVLKFRGIADRMNNSYLMWWLAGSRCQDQLSSLSTGSTALGIKANKLSAIECLVPPISEQFAIDNYIRDSIKRLSEIREAALTQIARLQERRSALISAAVTGQIDVRGLVPAAEAA
jgi:type I restriction enzyme, S subunit